MEQDSEFLLLNTINDLSHTRTGISQRDLSKAINMSLGMTNVLIKRLSQKGFILIQKVSPRNVTYILTPDGMNELAHRTYRYLKRTIKNVVEYKEAIVGLAKAAKIRGFSRIALLGQSDIEFIIEYAAGTAGLEYCRYQAESDIPHDTFVFVSENLTFTDQGSTASAIHLGGVLSGA